MIGKGCVMRSIGFECAGFATACILAFALPVHSQVCSEMQSANSRVFAPERQHELIAKDSDIRAAIQSFPFQLKITHGELNNGGALFQLPEELAQVDEICIWKDRIIVRGMVSNSLSEVVILNESGEMIDTFRAYWPNISEKSGLIIFTKEYPIHFAYGTEDHYLLYKLDFPAERNHAPGVVAIRSRPVGIPLYPLSTGNQDFDNIDLHGNVHEQVADGFFWDAEGEEAVTLDSYNGGFSLVLIQIEKDSATVRSLDIEPQSICESKPGAVCPTMLFLSRAVFVTDKDGTESVVTTFGRPQDPRFFEKTFPVSAFSVLGKRSLASPQWHP